MRLERGSFGPHFGERDGATRTLYTPVLASEVGYPGSSTLHHESLVPHAGQFSYLVAWRRPRYETHNRQRSQTWPNVPLGLVGDARVPAYSTRTLHRIQWHGTRQHRPPPPGFRSCPNDGVFAILSPLSRQFVCLMHLLPTRPRRRCSMIDHADANFYPHHRSHPRSGARRSKP